MIYTVTLVDPPNAPRAVLYSAELRFRVALDEWLGLEVGRCLRAFINANELGVGHLTREEIIDAARWIDAFEIATIAGCLPLCEVGEAYFAVRLG